MKQIFKLGLRLASLSLLSLAAYISATSNKLVTQDEVVDGLRISLGVGRASADVPPVDGWTVAIPGHVVGSGNPDVPVPPPSDGTDSGGDGCGSDGGSGGSGSGGDC